MSVDVLLATYNGEKYLKEQIASLLKQGPVNVIVRDDCSTDGTKEILEKYPFELHFGTENVGVKQNFSHLMRLAKNDYILFCDQDDVWMEGKVEKSLQRLLEMERIYGKSTPLLVHTDLTVVDENLKVIAPSFWKFAALMTGSSHQLNRLLVQNVVTGCALMMNRALLELAYPIPPQAVMHDWWLALVAAAFGKIEALPEAAIAYRQHTKNQIGAKKYTLQLPKRLKFRLKQFSPQHAQVEAFYERYRDLLRSDQKAQVEKYLELPNLPYLTGRYQILKHGFLKSGFLRRWGTFCLHKQP